VIKLFDPREVDIVWPYVADRIEQACRKAHSSMAPADIYKACRCGSWFLVTVHGDDAMIGVLVLDITAHPLGNTLNVIILAGDRAEDWFPGLLRDWDWLNSMGVKRVTGEGRSGMARLFAKGLPGVRAIREIYEWDRSNAE
jgi:hypothetical protein